MAFSENDYPVLLEKLTQLFSRETTLVREVVTREILKNSNEVPLYPALIAHQIPNMVVPATLTKIRDLLDAGRECEVISFDGEREIRGIVVKIEGDVVVLKQATVVTHVQEPLMIAAGNLRLVNPNAFREEWSTLYPAGEDDTKD